MVSLLVNGTVQFLDMIGPQLAFFSDRRVADVISSTKQDVLEKFDWGLVEHSIEMVNEAHANDIHYRVLKCFRDDKILQTWLEIGLGPVAGDSDCISSYLRWLHLEMYDDDELQNNTVHILCARRCLEALLYANPDVTFNKDAVTLAMKLDKRFCSGEEEQHWYMPARYILAGKKHGMCGHDGLLALNMTAPFLTECGFLAPRSLSKMLERHKKSLAPELNTYVQHAITTPKTLQVSCRDALRRHFVARRIHRFMNACGADLPSFVKDFILLKPLLRCIPKQLLYKLSDTFSE